jgi:hypothetical protein
VEIRIFHFLPAILWLSIGGALRAQEPAFTGMIRGLLIECDAPEPSGQFSLRAHITNQVYRFSFDAKTYIEREDQRITMSGVQKGDTLEVVSDRDENVAVHYARTVHVIKSHLAPPMPVGSGRYRMYRPRVVDTHRTSPLDFLAPRGDLTFSGVIARLTTNGMVLHTRVDGEKTILLRLDTRYLEGGAVVDAADLKPNTRVFVRAGKNLEDQIEAYQIVWGGILQPTPRR